MFVIFLDIDGVLNDSDTKERTPEGYTGIEDRKVKILRQLCEEFDAKIVLTSTWKDELKYNLTSKTKDGQYMLDKFHKNGIQIFDRIKDTSGASNRGQNIINWINDNGGVDDYVVLDDFEFDFRHLQDIKQRIVYTPNGIETAEIFDAEASDTVKQAIQIITNGKKKGFGEIICAETIASKQKALYAKTQSTDGMICFEFEACLVFDPFPEHTNNLSSDMQKAIERYGKENIHEFINQCVDRQIEENNVIYFELNNWSPGIDYPDREPFCTWLNDDDDQWFFDKRNTWVKENELCVALEIIDMSMNYCITAKKSWVQKECPELLTKYRQFLRFPDETGTVRGWAGTPFYEHQKENFGTKQLIWADNQKYIENKFDHLP